MVLVVLVLIVFHVWYCCCLFIFTVAHNYVLYPQCCTIVFHWYYISQRLYLLESCCYNVYTGVLLTYIFLHLVQRLLLLESHSHITISVVVIHLQYYI